MARKKNILEILGLKKKNSIDAFVDDAKATTDKAAQDVKDYAVKVTKPVGDFVTEVKGSETYGHIKDKAEDIVGDVKGAVGMYGPSGMPPQPTLGEKVSYAAHDIADDISRALPFKKKNSIDALVDDVKTGTDKAAHDVGTYVDKATKPIGDFVTEVKESQTYADIKDGVKDK